MLAYVTNFSTNRLRALSSQTGPAASFATGPGESRRCDESSDARWRETRADLRSPQHRLAPARSGLRASGRFGNWIGDSLRPGSSPLTLLSHD